MGGIILAVFYGSIIFCVIALVVRMVKYARAPLHIRWEFYRGSSTYESVDWWKKPHTSFGEKFKSAAQDIFLLRDYFKRNRSFWYWLYTFHTGLYLLVLWHVWIFIVPLVTNVDRNSTVGIVWGHVATFMVFIGAAGILVKRLTDKELKAYYSPLHYIKWLFILVTLAGGFYAVQVYFGGSMIEVFSYLRGQLAFELEHKLNPPIVTSLHVLFVSPWLIYLPFGHIMQIFFRYFHELRWDHVPNERGSDIERKVQKLLEHRVSWSAAHIQTGSKWGEVAQGLPENTAGDEK
ncbi:respiratory nitrate reductase subunit gamma [Chloroflexota bacterium]